MAIEEGGLFSRLVTLADTLVAGFDVIDLADQLVHSCLEFLPVSSAGIMLDDQRGNLKVLASSSEETHLLELFERWDEGFGDVAPAEPAEAAVCRHVGCRGHAHSWVAPLRTAAAASMKARTVCSGAPSRTRASPTSTAPAPART